MTLPRYHWLDVCVQAMSLDDDAAAEIDLAVARAPDDFELRVKRVGCLRRRNLPCGGDILWLTIHHPEIDLAALGMVHRDEEPEAHEAIRAAWEEHLARSPDSTELLRLTAQFCREDDPDFAETLLRRAAEIEPEEPRWPSLIGDSLMRRHAYEGDEQRRLTLATEALESYERALALESSDFGAHLQLCDIAQAAAAARRHDRGRGAALEVLQNAPKFEDTWQFGNSIHRANIVLGHIALDEGHVQEAEQRLLAAGATPGSPQLDSFGPDLDLARRLLAAGSPETVIAYLRDCGRFWQGESDNLSRWIEQIETTGSSTLEMYYPDAETDEPGP